MHLVEGIRVAEAPAATALFWNYFEKHNNSMAEMGIKNLSAVCLIWISFALTQVMFQEGIQTLGAGSFRFCAK